MGFFKWHENLMEKVMKWFGFSSYQLLWIAWMKGLLIGGLVVYLYMR